jgi:hypothetical protein
MLRLLAQREQGYDDIAALMGLSVEEVRARVRDALAELEAEGAEPPPLPPEPAAPQPPVPKPEPSAPEPPAPQPERPTPVAAATGEWKTPPPSPPPSRPRLAVPRDPGARAAILAGLAAVVAIVVILLVSGGGDESGGTASGGGTAAEQPTAGGGEREVTQAVLQPVGGSEASGKAVFGRFEEKLALQVQARGLEPTAKGEVYAVWLAQSPQRMLPLAEARVGEQGTIRAQYEIPVEILAYLANETFDQIAITLTEKSRLDASLAKAVKQGKEPTYTGTQVLRGEITGPIVGAGTEPTESE